MEIIFCNIFCKTYPGPKAITRRLTKRDSVLSNYFPPTKMSDSFRETNEQELVDSIETTRSEIPQIAPVVKLDHSRLMNVPLNATPDRVFKIVFIGDSGVGKTSFVQRFCHDSFRESFNTTIGVDFQVKLLLIENRIIALQLWDTVIAIFL